MKQPGTKMTGGIGVKKLAIILLSLVVYMIVTLCLMRYLFMNESIISSAADQKDPPTIQSDMEIIDATEYTCDTQNSPDFLPDGDVIKRALHGVIIGAMKGGTQALHTILKSHPRILSSSKGHGELHFFSDHGLRRLFHHGSADQMGLTNRAIPRQKLRDGFERILKNRTGLNSRRNGTHDITNDQNENKIGLHSAPIYLFSGRHVPARLMCVAPWAKVIAILRNPIDRAFSHYNFATLKSKPTFEEFVSNDIWLLKKWGVLQDWTSIDFELFSGSTQETNAWEIYIKKTNGLGPVGRGLYAIQLEIWMQEFKKVGKSVENDLLVLRSEETKENPKDTFHQGVEFLGLEKRRAKRRVIGKDHHKTDYTHEGMSDRTYKMLYDLFEPYNKRLYTLLGEDNWGGVWDEK